MSAVNVAVDLKGPLGRALRRFERKGRAAAEVMPVVADTLVAAVLETFEQQGPGWPALAPSTVKARRAQGAGAKILQDTGVLAGSIQPSTGTGAYGPWAAAGTNIHYGAFHVTGTSRMPRRDFLDVDLRAIAREAAELILLEVGRP